MAFAAQFLLHFNIANFVEPIIFGNTEDGRGICRGIRRGINHAWADGCGMGGVWR